MKQTASIAPAEPIQLRAGQVWKPTHGDIPAIAPVRIVCRYPFATARDGAMWIIEYMDAIQRLDRISESTLTALWYLATDVPTH